MPAGKHQTGACSIFLIGCWSAVPVTGDKLGNTGKSMEWAILLILIEEKLSAQQLFWPSLLHLTYFYVGHISRYSKTNQHSFLDLRKMFID